MLKFLQLPFVSAMLRPMYRLWTAINNTLHRYLFNNIRVSGTVDLEVDDTHIQMYAHADDGIVDALYFTGDSYGEYEEVVLFGELAKRAEVILDIGANTGLYSIISQRSNPKARVYAFEPYETNIERLNKNLQLNGLHNQVVVVEKALGNENKAIEFAVPEDAQISDVISADIEFTEQFSSSEHGFTTTQVPQVTLDAFVAEAGIARVDLMKLDVENYELSVFEGAMKTLKKHRPNILVEIFVDRERVQFFETHLAPLGYHCYLIGKKGLFLSDSLVDNPDCRNYLFSVHLSPTPYLSFSEMDKLVGVLNG